MWACLILVRVGNVGCGVCLCWVALQAWAGGCVCTRWGWKLEVEGVFILSGVADLRWMVCLCWVASQT